MKIRIFAIFISILLVHESVNAFCDHINKKKDKQSFYLGPLGLMVPEYDGAKKYRFLVVPNFNFTYGEHFIISPYRGFSFNLDHPKPFKFNVGIRYKFWFRSNRSNRFPGVNDLKPYWEGYFVSKYILKPVVFSLGAYHSLNKFKIGGFLRAGANCFIKVTEQFNIFLGPSTKISNKRHIRSLYKVSKTDSLSANIAEYDLSGGVEDIRFNTGMTYKFSERWNSHLMFSVKRILFDAAKSPLIENKHQYFANLSLSYKF